MKKIRKALLVFLIAYFVPSIASAKGNFTFIIIDGEDLRYEITVTDPALTADYFAFADFSMGSASPPPAPGIGYEITRWYTEGRESRLFDRLHYYPASGYVYYDGLINGLSDYDGQWFLARPEMQAKFAAVLKGEASRDLVTFAGTIAVILVLVVAFLFARKSMRPGR